jgi:hypothetical protein
MKLALAPAALLVGTLMGVQAPADAQELVCIAKVLYSEETPFAPIDYWHVNVTLQITAPDGRSFETTLHNSMHSQTPPPRQGQIFKVRCDPANPSALQYLN